MNDPAPAPVDPASVGLGPGNNQNGAQISIREMNREIEKSMEDRMIRYVPKTAAGRYLATTVGPVLAKALAEVVIKRPLDPIGHLASILHDAGKEWDAYLAVNFSNFFIFLCKIQCVL